MAKDFNAAVYESNRTKLALFHKYGASETTKDSLLSVISATRYNDVNKEFANFLAALLSKEQPITLRGLMYRAVSKGWLPDTSGTSYNRTKAVTKWLRELGIVPFEWIVDNGRETIRHNCWSGLKPFMQSVRHSYLRDVWEWLPDYVQIICEKDAISGVLSPITKDKYNVGLSPIRGDSSLSFAHEIAQEWKDIDKPIHAYYLGDYDVKGYQIEKAIYNKLRSYSGRDFGWQRLGFNNEDFPLYGGQGLLLKGKFEKNGEPNKAVEQFRRLHGERGAEVDAIPPDELRRRVDEAIQRHIPGGPEGPAWEWLEQLQAEEQRLLEELTDDKRWTGMNARCSAFFSKLTLRAMPMIEPRAELIKVPKVKKPKAAVLAPADAVAPNGELRIKIKKWGE